MMPELPEVETTLRGVRPHLEGRAVTHFTARQSRLRQPIPEDLATRLPGQPILSITRRAKYLIVAFSDGYCLIHLGMSGSLRIVSPDTPPKPHEHWDLALDSGQVLRYRDPRRFGLLLWATGDPAVHPLLAHLGPEPLSDRFSGTYLHRMAQTRKSAVKAFLMDGKVVVGVGNIYASESLFAAGISPTRAANRIALARYESLAQAVKSVLAAAIAQGGTTLRDFTASDGSPGYFRIALQVYGRAGDPCPRCGDAIQRKVIAQRATYYCPGCQH